MFARSLLLLSLALGTSACSKTDPPAKSAPAEKQPAADKGHAAASVTPGSHEDWCEEHQVAESQCTRCNPDLIAAFKATNDWCPEHGVPESQCKICNPALVIARPPKGK